MPVRIKHNKNTTSHPNGLPIVYVGRGSKWENPFVVKKNKNNDNYTIKIAKNYPVNEHLEALYDTYDITWVEGSSKKIMQRYAVNLHQEYLLPYNYGKKMEDMFFYDAIIKGIKIELKGKNLSCNCKTREPCHADLLLEIANMEGYPKY